MWPVFTLISPKEQELEFLILFPNIQKKVLLFQMTWICASSIQFPTQYVQNAIHSMYIDNRGENRKGRKGILNSLEMEPDSIDYGCQMVGTKI